MLKFNVNNQMVTRTDGFSVVADSQNYLTAEFTFSEEWTEPITAVFGIDGEFYNTILQNGRCIVPWEVIRAPFFTVSVFCGDRITANTVQISVEKSGYAQGTESRIPTPDVYAEILSVSHRAEELAQSTRNDADSGVFDGEKGDKGDKGDKGEPGDDYVLTAGDKTEIADIVRNEYFNDIGSALDNIINIQNSLTGGDNV